MSEPQPAMDQAEQAKVTRAIGRALLTVAPAEWTAIRAEYRSAGRHIEVDVFVAGPDRVDFPVRPPMEVVEGLGQLRAGMYQPGRGTWLSAVYNLTPPSSFSVDFEPDQEPRWRRLPPPIGFQDELRFFPRTDDHLPDWFRQRAGLPPAQPPTPTPPAGTPAPTPPPGVPQPMPAQAPTPPPGTPHQAPPPAGAPQPAPGQPPLPPPAAPRPEPAGFPPPAEQRPATPAPAAPTWTPPPPPAPPAT